jgi:hypothetical protein
MGEQGVDQGSVLVARRGVDDEAGRFIEHQQVVVFVEDGEGDRLRLRRSRDGRRALHSKATAGSNWLGRIAQERAIPADRASLDQGLDACAGQAADGVGEEAVGARASGLRPGHDLDEFGPGVALNKGRLSKPRLRKARVRQLEALGCDG